MYAFYFIAGAMVMMLVVVVVLSIYSAMTRLFAENITKLQDQITETKGELAKTQRDLTTAVEQNNQMNQRISELEAARVAKMNHRTYAALMDAMAFLEKSIWEDDLETIKEEQDLKAHKAQRQYLEYARAKLYEARDGRKDQRK